MEREEILANFQACTGIDDVAESILHLEETNWNLIDAVNRVMPQETQTLPSGHIYPNSALPMDVPELQSVGPRPIFTSVSAENLHPVSASSDIVILPSSSNSRTRLLNFLVQVGDRTIPINLPERETVGMIKTILYKELNIPPCQQELRGWKSTTVTDNTLLSTLNLPKENFLILDTPVSSSHAAGTSNESDSKITATFVLNVCDVTDGTNIKPYRLNYPGTKTVSEVKQDVFSLTNIPVRHQVWQGWPDSIKNENTCLANTDIGNVLNLTVQRMENTDMKQPEAMVVDLASDSSGGGFEDASESFGMEDDLFSQEMSSKKFQPLMPEGCKDDNEAVSHFISKFTNRYGEGLGMFYSGDLDDAVREAFTKPAKERKLLAIYLHDDGSILSNVFCTQLLCAETVVSYLTTNFITWPWDLTLESNRSRLLSMLTHHFGSLATSTVRNFTRDELPILLVIMKIRSTTEVFTVIHGNVTLDELLTRLIHAVEVFSGQQQLEIVEEEERDARERVKREQDAAYEASLMADRAKDEAKRLEEQEKERVAKLEEVEREKQQQERQEEEAKKNALRRSLERQLPDEPEENCGDPVAQIRIRLPNGDFISRRFLASTPLRVLFQFLMVQGYSCDDYKVLSSWPRKDLTDVDPSCSLAQLKLYPQETITLEER